VDPKATTMLSIDGSEVAGEFRAIQGVAINPALSSTQYRQLDDHQWKNFILTRKRSRGRNLRRG
jgi:hypothetical protein